MIDYYKLKTANFYLNQQLVNSDYIHAVVPIPDFFEKLPEKSENGNLDACIGQFFFEN